MKKTRQGHILRVNKEKPRYVPLFLFDEKQEEGLMMNKIIKNYEKSNSDVMSRRRRGDE